MANEKTPVVWDDTTKKHRPLGTGEKMGGLDASSIISSDSGNLIQTGSDGLAYLSGSGMVDPRADNLLEESDRGKLQVTVDRIAEWLDGHPQDAAVLADAINVVSGDSGNVIVEGSDKGAFLSKGAIATAVQGMTDADKNKLADAIAARIASDIADGKTIVASGGKLTSDPSNATPAQKKKINEALADADSGLVVDSSTGKLKVDFSNMPTDKFEELLKSLSMLVPLTSSKHLYVDVNSGSDTLDDGRGTQAKPFKHIQNCVNYLVENYSLGRWDAVIHVGAGEYEESLTLPAFSTGTGHAYIRSTSGARDVTLKNPSYGDAVNVSGGPWHIEHFNIERTERGPGITSVYATVALNDGARLYLAGNTYKNVFPNNFSNGGVYYETRMFSVDNATLYWSYSDMDQAITCADHADATASVFAIMRGGQLIFRGYAGTDATRRHGCSCSGSTDVFAGVSSNSSVTNSGSGLRPTFTGTVAGKRYSVTGGSSIQTPPVSGVQPEEYFPGSVSGTVEDSTYCWYK